MFIVGVGFKTPFRFTSRDVGLPFSRTGVGFFVVDGLGELFSLFLLLSLPLFVFGDVLGDALLDVCFFFPPLLEAILFVLQSGVKADDCE